MRLDSENLKTTRPSALALAPTAQLHDLLQLKQENAYLTTITKQITPYIRSIAKVKERLEPRSLWNFLWSQGSETSHW